MKVFAIRYASSKRPSRELFLRSRSGEPPRWLAYYIWIIETPDGLIAVDTGFTEDRAKERGRNFEHAPRDGLAILGIDPKNVQTLILTHLHYDHAGDLSLYPNAEIVLQAEEMAHATGPDMASAVMRAPFALPDILLAVTAAFEGRIRWLDGDATIVPSVCTLAVGGHSRGLQAVEVATDQGPLILASDAAHLYENVASADPFPIIVDVAQNLASHDRLMRRASNPKRFVPGHDPLVGSLYENVDGHDWIVDLTRPLDCPHPLA